MYIEEVERAAAAVLQSRGARQYQPLVRAEAAVGFRVVGGQVAEGVQRRFELPSVPELQAAAAGEAQTTLSGSTSMTSSRLCASDRLLTAHVCPPTLKS